MGLLCSTALLILAPKLFLPDQQIERSKIASSIVVFSADESKLEDFQKNLIITDLTKLAGEKRYRVQQRDRTLFIFDDVLCRPKSVVSFEQVLRILKNSSSDNVYELNSMSPSDKLALKRAMLATPFGGFASRAILNDTSAKVAIHPSLNFEIESGGKKLMLRVEPGKSNAISEKALTDGASFEQAAKTENEFLAGHKNTSESEVDNLSSKIHILVRSASGTSTSETLLANEGFSRLEAIQKEELEKVKAIQEEVLADFLRRFGGFEKGKQAKVSDLDSRAQELIKNSLMENYMNFGFSSRNEAEQFFSSARATFTGGRFMIGFGARQTSDPASPPRFRFAPLGG